MAKTDKNVKSKVLLPFRWAGGKYYALKILQKFWEIEHDEYREPFLGGGSVFWAKDKVKTNWINDIDSDLVSTLELITDYSKRDKLIEMFEGEIEATREKHTLVKNMTPKNDIEKAYKYYYLNRTSFSGKMKNPSWGYLPKRSLPPIRWKERLIPCSEKLQGVNLTNLDFEEVINAPAKKNQKVLIFLDPPYYLAKQESHYVMSFKKEDHERLSRVLSKTKHKFFLTYDDCEEIRALYTWAHIYEINFFYRLDNSKDSEDKRKKGNELVITNYRIDE
jgi:DNA adenine methylase